MVPHILSVWLCCFSFSRSLTLHHHFLLSPFPSLLLCSALPRGVGPPVGGEQRQRQGGRSPTGLVFLWTHGRKRLFYTWNSPDADRWVEMSYTFHMEIDLYHRLKALSTTCTSPSALSRPGRTVSQNASWTISRPWSAPSLGTLCLVSRRWVTARWAVDSTKDISYNGSLFQSSSKRQLWRPFKTCLFLIQSGLRVGGETKHQFGLLPQRLAVSHGPRLCLHPNQGILETGTLAHNYQTLFLFHCVFYEQR